MKKIVMVLGPMPPFVAGCVSWLKEALEKEGAPVVVIETNNYKDKEPELAQKISETTIEDRSKYLILFGGALCESPGFMEQRSYIFSKQVSAEALYRSLHTFATNFKEEDTAEKRYLMVRPMFTDVVKGLLQRE